MTEQEAMGMLDLAETLTAMFDKEEIIKIYRNLGDWVRCGSDISVKHLKDIAIGYKGDKVPVAVFNPEVKRHLMELYANASSKGDYAVKVLEAGISADRGSRILQRLILFTDLSESKLDIVPYVKDKKWSDEWIEAIVSHTGEIYEVREDGYDLLRVFTPQHSIRAFNMVISHFIPKYYKGLSIEWMADCHWSHSTISNVLSLYNKYPECDWGRDIIHPWMCRYISEEIEQRGVHTDNGIKSVIDKWINVSPILDAVLYDHCKKKDASSVYLEYKELRSTYGLDGDKLANKIHSGKLSEYWVSQNKYYHECIDKYKAGQCKSKDANINAMLNAVARMGGD